MKTSILSHLCVALIASLLSFSAYAQGTFVYDQQSSIEGLNGESSASIQSLQPMGQSFTPLFSSVGFIRLRLARETFGSLGASIYMNLRENSITGNILGASSLVSLPAGFIGYTNFFFSTPVAVTPGTTYFFQPVIGSGDPFGAAAYNGFDYAGGTAYSQGAAVPGFDLWFREGIVVPEPSVAWLLLVAGGLAGWRHRKRLFQK
jgi:hypothetical protein